MKEEFGKTECGVDFIATWFDEHKCDKFCNLKGTKWLKFDDNINVKVKRKVVKRTSYSSKISGVGASK